MRPEDLAFSPDALGTPGRGVRVRWLGTAGFSLTYEGVTVLLDPYLSRCSLGRCAVGALRVNEALLAREVPEAHAIVCGHTHFDHALDVPSLARRTGARVLGSRSLATLCRAGGVPHAQLDVVEPGAHPVEREVGPFRLRFFASAHSALLLGRVPFAGDIADCSDVPSSVGAFRCGSVLRVELEVAGRRLVHLGSAELVESGPAARDADLLLLCVAGWTTTRELPERIVREVSPAAVLLSHWDDFFRPFHEPARALPAMRLPALVDRLGRASPSARVGTVPLGGELWVGP